jgi:L-fuconolactonase
LSEAIKFIDLHPNQRFVLDHAAKPKIFRGELEPWRTNMRALSSRANVTCKISGLVTEAAWSHWTLESLRPYLDNCVEAFGADRLIAGSDWPVCLLATNYSRWWDVLRHYFADFSGEEVDRIFGGNAMSFYGLGDKPKI